MNSVETKISGASLFIININLKVVLCSAQGIRCAVRDKWFKDLAKGLNDFIGKGYGGVKWNQQI